MGIFTRFRDIVSSNINAMLEKAEDPEKLIKLMIQEMEDTLVEIKASCAALMAELKRHERASGESRALADRWAGKAQLAVNKGREDLAREALVEKRRYLERAAQLEADVTQCEDLIEQYRSEIVQLEEKLQSAREKQRVLVQRHVHAQDKKRAQHGIRKFETSDAMMRFDKFENRIDRMEAEADLINYGRGKPSGAGSLEEELAGLEGDEEIEKELAALKGNKKNET
ncbi:MAG: phage shock protein PspA [Opitutales bacterium]